MKEADMAQVGHLIARALSAVDNETALNDVRKDVSKICDRFPLYASRLAAYDKALARA
jgi:glycine hydroxymethyltransferase